MESALTRVVADASRGTRVSAVSVLMETTLTFNVTTMLLPNENIYEAAVKLLFMSVKWVKRKARAQSTAGNLLSSGKAEMLSRILRSLCTYIF